MSSPQCHNCDHPCITIAADWRLLLVLTVCLQVTCYIVLLQAKSVSKIEPFVTERCQAVTEKFI